MQNVSAAAAVRRKTWKLTADQVVEIRRLAVEGMPQHAIGRRFGIDQTTAGSIIRGETWAHIPGAREGSPNYPKGERHPRARLTEAQAREIHRLAAEGMAQRDIAARFGVSPALVCKIVGGRLWKHLPAAADTDAA